MLERTPTRRELRVFCESQGYPWNHVSRELKRYRLIFLSDAEPGLVPSSRTPEGVLVDDAAFVRLVEQLGGLQKPCPSRVRQMNTRTLFTSAFPRVDDSWFCPSCAVGKADRVLKATLTGMEKWPAVFVATAPWDKALLRRVGERKRDRVATVLWFRRADDAMFFLSDKSLEVNGAKAPTAWPQVALDEVNTLLTDEVLALPGLVGHWPVSQGPPARRKKLLENISLDGMDDRLVARLETLVAEEVGRRGWPFRPFEDVVPEYLHAEMVNVINDAKDRVWRETLG
jgi:hypothetical protein